jgi:hypothetical protein
MPWQKTSAKGKEMKKVCVTQTLVEKAADLQSNISFACELIANFSQK